MDFESSPVCRVLYVEDTQADQQILQEAISFADVPLDLVTATTAQAALKLLLDGTLFHVLVLDWHLPSVTGAEFLADVRAAQPKVPIIILTGEPRLVDAATAAALGASTIVKKPLVLEEWEQLACQLYKHCDSHSAKVARTT